MNLSSEVLLKLLADNRIDSIASLVSDINLGATKQKFNKDADRIKAFVQASIFKIVSDSIQVTDLLEAQTAKAAESKAATLKLFITDFYKVMVVYADATEKLSKFQFPKDLWSGKFKDPWKECRQVAREVNSKWELGVDL